jgi:hypothetical protein
MSEPPTPVRRDRLITYVLVLTSVLADCALQIETGRPTVLNREQFVVHAIDVITGALASPSTVEIRP